jgi:hypothetical protein
VVSMVEGECRGQKKRRSSGHGSESLHQKNALAKVLVGQMAGMRTTGLQAKPEGKQLTITPGDGPTVRMEMGAADMEPIPTAEWRRGPKERWVFLRLDPNLHPRI